MIDRMAKLVAIGAISLILFGACGGEPNILAAGQPTAEAIEQPGPVLHELTGVDQFKVAFNEDEGVPRLILLLSPT